MTTAFISLPAQARSGRAADAAKPGPSQGILLDWTHRHSDHGVVLSARIAPAGTHAPRSSGYVHMALDDRQLRALTIDLVRASMMRGIDFKGRRRWWRFW